MTSATKRAAFTVGILASVLFAHEVLVLPGLDAEVVAQWPDARLSALSLALGPYLVAAVLVEFATLVHKPWARMRVGGPADRAAIEGVTRGLWLLLAGMQSFAMAMSLEAMTIGSWPLVLSPGFGFRIVTVATLVAGSALVLLAVEAIRRHGLGNGVALWVGVSFLLEPGDLSGLFQHPNPLELLVAAFAAIGTGAVTVWHLNRKELGGMPASGAGIVPITDASSLAVLVATLQGTAPHFAVVPITAFLLAVIYTQLFHPPATIAGVIGRPESDVRRILPQLTIYSTVYIALLWGGAFFLRDAGIPVIDVVTVATVVAIAWDLRTEWQARTAHGPLVVVWPLHRVYAAAPAIQALQDAGILAHVRGLRLRQLYQFFAPFVPIELLVEEDQAEEAHEVLTRWHLAAVSAGTPAEPAAGG